MIWIIAVYDSMLPSHSSILCIVNWLSIWFKNYYYFLVQNRFTQNLNSCVY